MNVIYNTDTGAVVATGDAVAGDGEASVELPKSAVAQPITGTFVDDVTTPTETVADLATIKKLKKNSIKQAAYERLEPYDWYIIRKQEEGTAIPTEVSTYRSDVRATEDNATDAVKAATSVSEVRAVDPNWPSEPSV